MKDNFVRVSSSHMRYNNHSKVDESKRVAFYTPISEGLPLRDCTPDFEARSPCSEEEKEERKTNIEKRGMPNSSFESFTSTLNNSSTSSLPTTASSSSNGSGRQVFDFSHIDDDDSYSVTSAYTYNTVATNATTESVQSIISRLQSETDRRRRRLMRRRYARSGNKVQAKQVKPKDLLNGITVEVRES